MGTTITKPATIVVQLDSDQEHGGVVAGTLLRGKIYLDVRAATVDCASLQLVVEGSEHTAVHYTTHSGTGCVYCCHQLFYAAISFHKLRAGKTGKRTTT